LRIEFKWHWWRCLACKITLRAHTLNGCRKNEWM
jgi:hypothetical protein